MTQLHRISFKQPIQTIPAGDIIQVVQADPGTWSPALVALVCGLLSGLAHVCGSALGIALTSVPEDKEEVDQRTRAGVVAACLAVGAGSLIFSVAIAMYGEDIWDLEHDGYSSGALVVFVSVVAAILSATFFAYLDTYVYEGYVKGAKPSPVESSEETSSSMQDNTMHWQETWKDRFSRQTSSEKNEKDAEVQTQSDAHMDEALGMATWRVMFYQAVPEALLIGVQAAKQDLSVVLIISLFLATVPESFSSACLLRESNVPPWKILLLWTALGILIAVAAAIIAGVLPSGDAQPLGIQIFSSVLEGVASGAWLACITGVMLPKAYEARGSQIGLLVTVGFLGAVVVRIFGGLAEEWTHEAPSHIAINS